MESQQIECCVCDTDSDSNCKEENGYDFTDLLPPCSPVSIEAKVQPGKQQQSESCRQIQDDTYTAIHETWSVLWDLERNILNSNDEEYLSVILVEIKSMYARLNDLKNI